MLDAPLPPLGFRTPAEAAAVAKLDAAAKAKKKAKKAKKRNAARRDEEEDEEGEDLSSQGSAFSLVPASGAWALPSSLGFGAFQEESSQLSPMQAQGSGGTTL